MCIHIPLHVCTCLHTAMCINMWLLPPLQGRCAQLFLPTQHLLLSPWQLDSVQRNSLHTPCPWSLHWLLKCVCDPDAVSHSMASSLPPATGAGRGKKSQGGKSDPIGANPENSEDHRRQLVFLFPRVVYQKERTQEAAGVPIVTARDTAVLRTQQSGNRHRDVAKNRSPVTPGSAEPLCETLSSMFVLLQQLGLAGTQEKGKEI